MQNPFNINSNYNEPPYKEPNYNKKRFKRPNYKEPPYNGPNYKEPPYNGPNYPDRGPNDKKPRHNGPNYKEKRYKEPRNKKPRYKEPRYNEQPYEEERYDDQPYDEPRYEEPNYNVKQRYSRDNDREVYHEYPKHKVEMRQNYGYETEDYINKQINMELAAANDYLSMSAYFARSDVALPGFAAWFRNCSNEEREHADKLIDYQNLRGGIVKLGVIRKPSRINWGSALEALKACLHLEKKVNASILKLVEIAEDLGDGQLVGFCECFLNEQVESIKEISDLITKLKRVGPNIGVHMIDKELQAGGNHTGGS